MELVYFSGNGRKWIGSTVTDFELNWETEKYFSVSFLYKEMGVLVM